MEPELIIQKVTVCQQKYYIGGVGCTKGLIASVMASRSNRDAVVAKVAPGPGKGKGRNRVAVDHFGWTRTQGRLADSPTPGWRTQSLWDC